MVHGQEQKTHSFSDPYMSKEGKGKFYISFGYNLDWYTKSDIHFYNTKGDNYDFTLYDVKAKDYPGIKNIFHQNITIPQYSYRFGYYLAKNRNWAIEINYDHTKYIAIADQKVRMKGHIHDAWFDTDTILHKDFIQYEHTNGANYFMLNAVRRLPILHSDNNLHWLSTIIKAGAGPVVPRSDTYIFNNRRNEKYHVAGFVTGVDIGLRYDFLRRFHIETSGKFAYANYSRVFLYGDGNAKQHWYSFEYIFTLGYQFDALIF